MDKSEILVHISAPSGAADDARYRAQVEAILNFQLHSRETITTATEHLASSHPIPSSSALQKEIETIYNSSLDIQAPVSPLQVLKRHVSQRDSFESPVSVIPDSQLQQQAFDAECLSPRPAPTSIAQWLPSKRPRVDSPPPREPSQHVEVPPSIAEDSTAHLNPPVIEPPGTIITAKKETEQDERPPAEKGTPQPIPILPSLPLEIKPPPPPISTSPYTTHITPTLETLTKRLKSPRTYNPSSQTRALDNLERGYWFLRISLVSETESESAASWTTPFFSKFWTFLSDFIAKEARAGWGVWCILEEEKETGDSNANTNADVNAPSQHTAGDPPPEPAQTNLTLKIYTWGEIASHIYLLLFLASDRRVRKMGAQWRDATDEVVIQMP